MRELGLGGDDRASLSRELMDAESRLAEVSARHQRLTDELAEVGITPAPTTASDYAELRATAETELAQAAPTAIHDHAAHDAFAEARRELRQIDEELRVLRMSRSNIDPALQQERARLAQELGLTEKALPFAGELIEVLPEFADGLAAQYYVGHGAAFGEDVHGFTIDGGPSFPRLASVDEEHDRRYYAITVNPQVFINLVPDHVIFHRMSPLAADRTVVECDWLFAPEVVAEGADVSRSVELFHRVNQQDFEACERCQPNMTSRVYERGGFLVPSEHHIAEFHRWVTAHLAT